MHDAAVTQERAPGLCRPRVHPRRQVARKRSDDAGCGDDGSPAMRVDDVDGVHQALASAVRRGIGVQGARAVAVVITGRESQDTSGTRGRTTHVSDVGRFAPRVGMRPMVSNRASENGRNEAVPGVAPAAPVRTTTSRIRASTNRASASS